MERSKEIESYMHKRACVDGALGLAFFFFFFFSPQK
jgi:hypothetical protein